MKVRAFILGSVVVLGAACAGEATVSDGVSSPKLDKGAAAWVEPGAEPDPARPESRDGGLDAGADAGLPTESDAGDLDADLPADAGEAQADAADGSPDGGHASPDGGDAAAPTP